MEQLAQEFPLDKDSRVAWDIGNGEKLRVGIDPFIGDNGNFKLPEGITEELVVLNITTLNKIRIPYWVVLREGYWFGSKDLWFTGIYNYIKNLNAGIRLRNEEDKIMWSWNKTNGQITAREAYSSIV